MSTRTLSAANQESPPRLAPPSLAPPGAGLPFPELLIARVLFGLRRRLTSRRATTDAFTSERLRVAALVRNCPPSDATQPILIDRPRGLEDSSRYWSVFMTLDHLRIVHEEIARVIGALCAGHEPHGQASTAAVKPSPVVDAGIVRRYEASCDRLLETVAEQPSLVTKQRYRHPWFGPLDAAGWHALSATHMRIHRVQLERILEGLERRGHAAEHA